MVYIHASRSFSLYRRYVNSQIVLIFLICLVNVSFTFNNIIWMINVVNITGCTFLKQQFKGIIILIIVFRCELIPKRSTKINIIQGIFNQRNWGTSGHYRITMINIDRINFFQLPQNLFIGNITPICFYTSISVLDCRLEYNHNTTQRLINVLVLQFLRAHQMKYP